MKYYAVMANSEIAISLNQKMLKTLYGNAQILPADYDERIYVVVDGKLVIDTAAEQKAQLAALDAEYRAEKANLCEAYTTASMQGDTETAESVAADMAELDAWFDEEYERVCGGLT